MGRGFGLVKLMWKSPPTVFGKSVLLDSVIHLKENTHKEEKDDSRKKARVISA